MKSSKNIFAVACFAFFLTALTTGSPFAFLAAMVCGAFSRAVQKKGAA